MNYKEHQHLPIIANLTSGGLLKLFVSLIIGGTILPCYAQNKRVVAIGSSTTAGTGAIPKDSSWTGLLNKYYKCQAGLVDSVYNLGVPGTDIYQAMPTGYTPPLSRPFPDINHNISKASMLLSNLPIADGGVVLVNYPTNGYNTYTIAEIMSSLQTVYDSAIASGNRCFITTTQPRTDGSFNSPGVKKKLADIKDSIINRFGTAHTLNFWDGMYNPADTSILDKYASGDLIHFNNAGHRELFNRVVEKNIFGLPVWYSKATGSLSDLTTWGNNADGSGTSPASFMADYQLFKVVNNPSPTITANWVVSGKNTRVIIGDGINPVNLIIPQGLKFALSNPAVSSCY